MTCSCDMLKGLTAVVKSRGEAMSWAGAACLRLFCIGRPWPGTWSKVGKCHLLHFAAAEFSFTSAPASQGARCEYPRVNCWGLGAL